MYQTDKFASSENEGTLVLILGDFVVLAEVEGFVLQVVAPKVFSTKDEVVAQVLVADLGQASALGDRVTGGALLPSEAHVLGQELVFREAGDVDNLGQDTSSGDSAQSLDGDDGIGNGIDVTGNPLV